MDRLSDLNPTSNQYFLNKQSQDFPLFHAALTLRCCAYSAAHLALVELLAPLGGETMPQSEGTFLQGAVVAIYQLSTYNPIYRMYNPIYNQL